MQNIQFDPGDVTIKAGETVTWTNDEGVAHDVDKTSGPGPQFSSGPEGGMMEGDTFEHTFDQAGPTSTSAACMRRAWPARSKSPSRPAGALSRRRSPKPRSRSSAVSPSPPRAGSSPSWVAAS